MTTTKPAVTIYTQPGCPPCKAAKEFLTHHGVQFNAKDITQDDAAVDELIALESQSTPTIVVGKRVMIGFRPTELLQWIQEGAAPAQ